MHPLGTGLGRTEPSIDSGVVDCLSSLPVFLVVNVESHAIGFPVGIMYSLTRKRKKNATEIRSATACCLSVAPFWKRAASAAVMHEETGRANWGLGAGSESRMVLSMQEKGRSSSRAPEVHWGSRNPANTSIYAT